jgi:pimeloyl-ACP methyl ester carboxylesterase
MTNRKSLVGLAIAAAAGGAAAVAIKRRRGAAVELPPLEHDPLAPLRGRDRDLVMSDGGTISLTDMGPSDGPAVVLIHGWVNDRRVWCDVAPRLVEAGHRVIAYDQRGHGRSRVGSSSCTINRLGDDLHEVLAHLDIDDVAIAGHSMGGMATQAMLIDHASDVGRVRSIVLVATGAAGVGLPPQARALAEAVIGWERGDAFMSRAGIGNAIVRSAFGRKTRPEHINALREMLLSTPIPTRREFLRAMHAMDLRSGLPEIKVPTSIIVGTVDTLTPPARARYIASQVPGATLEVLPGRGHMLTWEAPDEVVHLIQLAAKVDAAA